MRPLQRSQKGELRITAQDYDKKARELKERQTEIGLRIEQHQKGDGDYRMTVESLISLASHGRALRAFESRPKAATHRIRVFRTYGSEKKA